MMALVRPAFIAIERNVAPMVVRSGMPNDTFEAPSVMFTPSSSWMSEIVSKVFTTSEVSAPMGMASGSMQDVLDGDAVLARGDVHDLPGELEAPLGLLGDLEFVVRQRDDGGAVALHQRQDRFEPLVLGGHRVDECFALVSRQPGVERLDHRRVDAERQVGQALDQLHRLDHQIDLVGERSPHVDVEHHGATGHLLRDVDLDTRQVTGAQLILEDLATGRVDAFADDAERLVVDRPRPPWRLSGGSCAWRLSWLSC